MASVVAILDLKGKPLIQRSYRDDVDPAALERFLPLLTEIEEEREAGAIQPCLSSQGVNYMHVRHSNLYRTSKETRISDLTDSACAVAKKYKRG